MGGKSMGFLGRAAAWIIFNVALVAIGAVVGLCCKPQNDQTNWTHRSPTLKVKGSPVHLMLDHYSLSAIANAASVGCSRWFGDDHQTNPLRDGSFPQPAKNVPGVRVRREDRI